jgi:hypothetical protein
MDTHQAKWNPGTLKLFEVFCSRMADLMVELQLQPIVLLRLFGNYMQCLEESGFVTNAELTAEFENRLQSVRESEPVN